MILSGWVEKNRHPVSFVRLLIGNGEHGGKLRAKLEKKHLDMIGRQTI